jgi:DNA invertase Pin-like site-specific DNA recombinase
MARIGYGRVSTADQNPDSQHDALTEAGCDKIFVDKASGKLASRPELDKALEYARAGDTFVITRLSRAARSLRNLLELADTLRERGIDLVVLKQGIDTTTPTGRLVFHMLGAIDEFQRELIVEGTHEGLAAARARGRNGGRPSSLTETQIHMARQMYDSEEYTVEQIAETFKTSRATIYRALDPGTGALALVAYRGKSGGGIDEDGRYYGETGLGEPTQLEADCKYWPLNETKKPFLKAFVVVAKGVVTRVRLVDPDPNGWKRDPKRPKGTPYWEIPMSAPLTAEQIAEHLPTLGLQLGDAVPHQRGKLRELRAL